MKILHHQVAMITGLENLSSFVTHHCVQTWQIHGLEHFSPVFTAVFLLNSPVLAAEKELYK